MADHGAPRAAARAPVIGMGCMRLSTEPDRDEARAVAVLHAAFDAGVTFLDTADAYCWDDTETGHNERLIARALSAWTGDRARIAVATKGGVRRTGGRWEPDGRAKHLAAACEASRAALGVERIGLYQLHAPDPRTPFATSVRALASLQRDGAIASVGLCNVTVGQIEEARRHVEIAAVQVELSLWHDASILGGVVDYCLTNGIRLIAYRPLGGPQRLARAAADRVLQRIAARRGATPHEVALAWLHGLSDLVVPIPGPTRVETVSSMVRASRLAPSPDDRAELDERFPAGRALRLRQAPPPPPVSARSGREIVLVMGLPAAGKSTLARALAAEGGERLNRDEAGGSLKDLVPALERLLAAGAARIVLDNTYVTRRSRAPVIGAASHHGIPIRCVWLSTSVEEAQVNAVSRMLARHGRLLMPEEIKATSKRDPSVFGPGVQFRYQRELEPPDRSEGFSGIDVIPFERRHDPSRQNRALLIWMDGVLRRSRSGRRTPIAVDDVEVSAGRGEVLRRYRDDGWRLLGISWQPEIADETMSAAEVDACLARTQELLGVELEMAYCPHAAGPPVCWCRKPLPGLGVVFVHRHALDPARCLYVGSGPQDPGFARRLGFGYRDAEEFFKHS